jgi:hypothetical protein
MEVHRREGWGQLTRTRVVHGPAEAAAEFRFLDRVDEIQDVDLLQGIHTGVEAAFTAAATRFGEAWEAKARSDRRVLHELPPSWRLHKKSMKALLTPEELCQEGRDMSHCVGGYVQSTESGQSFCLSLRIKVGKKVFCSTAELLPNGHVLQHRGVKNGEAPKVCERLLQSFRKRSGLVH